MRNSVGNSRKRVMKLGIPYSRVLKQREIESFLKKSPFSLGWRWKYIKPVLTSEREKQNVVNMLTSKVRNLDKYPKIQKFLKHHNVVITLTTSPTRLPKLASILATLDLTNVSHINVVLPLKYGAKKEEYKKIPSQLKMFPKVRIVRIKKDLGPLTKMIHTITTAKNKYDIVISIDDDVAYPMGMINELIYQKIEKYPDAVLTMGVPMPFFTSVKGMREYWPQAHVKRPLVDVVEGWSSVLYSPNLVNSSCMKSLSIISKECFLSDDFVISYALAYANVKKITLNNNYAFNPSPYEFGAGADALHAGRDIKNKPKTYIRHSDEINFKKYETCLKNIREYVDRVKHGKEKDYCGFRLSRREFRLSNKNKRISRRVSRR